MESGFLGDGSGAAVGEASEDTVVPECDEDDWAIPMAACPKCDKQYVSDATKAQAEYFVERKTNSKLKPPKKQDHVCPHCKANLTQYWRDGG